LKSTSLGEFALFLYGSQAYTKKHGMPKNSADLTNHTFVGYIDELLAIHAVRWLDEVITAPKICFHSNSIIAQCSAAVLGLGIALLPTFVAAGVAELDRILPDQISVRREVWMSVRTEQNHLVKIKQVSKFLKRIFESDVDFLLGKTDQFPR
jgi:DNA-binding transcriptional LysR family regulator